VRQQGRVPELPGVRTADARALVAGFLDGTPGGGWLPDETAASLLACYEIPLAAAGPAAESTDGVEVLAGVVAEPVFGPLVVFGLGGAAPAILGARAARLSPLTDADAAEMIRGVSGAELLFGPPAGPAVDVAALAGLLLRVSRLADDLPEVAELDLSPVTARPSGVRVRAARVRVSPIEPQDPFLRRLR
jgi:acyl-CoA synthetase (NDP forming)